MDHGGHGGMAHDMCSMNMLFTWDTTNLCIVFRGWRVSGTWSLIWSLLGIVVLTAGYELVRELSRRYETATARGASALDRGRNGGGAGTRSSKTVKALFYAVQVFYSFFIMLLFMTYNGWVMLAVAFGAFVGYLMFGSTSATKTVACH